MQALGLLFDPPYSSVQLDGIQVTGPSQIEADWVLGGYLKFPWTPKVTPFKGGALGGWEGGRGEGGRGEGGGGDIPKERV